VKRILYSSPLVPAEWIEAHGLEPERLVPRGAGSPEPIADREGVCPFMRMFLNEACAREDAAAVVLTTTCDQMCRGADLAGGPGRPLLFLMNVPATWQTVSAHRLYRSELERLGGFLIGLGGAAPSEEDLWRTLLEHDERRRTAAPTDDGRADGIPVAILGGPVAEPDRALIRALEQAGGRVVLDGTEGGERTAPAAIDRRRRGRDPLSVLVEARFAGYPDAFRRPNSQLFQWLERAVASREVGGAVLLRYVWCDLWHAEVQRLAEWLEIPLLDLDLDGRPITSRDRARIQAFMEGLAG